MATDQTQTVAGTAMIAYKKAWATGNALPTAAAYGTAWTGYTDVGYTRDGLHFALNVQRTPIVFDQDIDPVLRLPQSRDLRVTTRLGQITATNLQDASGQGTLTTVAAGSGTRGTDTLKFTGTISTSYVSVGFEVQGQDNEAVQVLLKKGLIEGDITLDFVRNEAALINFNVGAVPDTSTSPTELAFFRDISAALP